MRASCDCRVDTLGGLVAAGVPFVSLFGYFFWKLVGRFLARAANPRNALFFMSGAMVQALEYQHLLLFLLPSMTHSLALWETLEGPKIEDVQAA